MFNRNFSLLRLALAADAIVSGAVGVLLITAASVLSSLFGLSIAFLSIVGLVLIPYAAYVGRLASHTHPPRTQAWLVVGMNALWVVDSAALLFSGWVRPTALGTTFIVMQAVIVGVLAELQFIGVRRATVSIA